METTILNAKEIKSIIKYELLETWADMKQTPNMSWVMEAVQEELCNEMIIHTRGNQTKAARMLGINRGTFRNRVSKAKRKDTE